MKEQSKVKELLEEYRTCLRDIDYAMEWGDGDTEAEEKRIDEIEKELVQMCEGKHECNA